MSETGTWWQLLYAVHQYEIERISYEAYVLGQYTPRHILEILIERDYINTRNEQLWNLLFNLV